MRVADAVAVAPCAAGAARGRREGGAEGGADGGAEGEARALLVRLPNWVGDVCMALPAIEALSGRGFALQLVGRRWAGDLLEAHGWPVIAAPQRLLEAARALRATGVRHGLLFTNSLSSAAAFRLAGVRALGHRNEGRSPLLGRAIGKPREVHEVDSGWRLARETLAWRCPRVAPLPPRPPPSLGLRLTDVHRSAAEAALRVAFGDPDVRFVVLAPLAVGTIRGEPKVWPGFAALAHRLERRGIATVCCPGPGEAAATRAAVPGAVVLPDLGLGAYAAICGRARLTVSNDSGPMHLAAARDAPVLGIFGPSAPARCHPWGPRARWLGGDGRWPGQAEVEAVVDAMLS